LIPDAGAAILRRRFRFRPPAMRHCLVAAFALLLAFAPAAAHDGHAHDPGLQPIADGVALQPADGRLEVVEVFAYTCGHCANFQPILEQWKRTAPANVRFAYLPAAFDLQNTYARAYFAAESLGVLGRFHAAAYDAIHRSGLLPARGATASELAGFAGSLGIDAARFRAAMDSPATDAKMAAAREFAVRNGIQGTPTLVVDGRYRVQGGSFRDSLRLVDALAAEAEARPAGR
jgi:protein dithiol oxidoreductase (disulfide-forming)